MRKDRIYHAAMLLIAALLAATTTRRYSGLGHVPRRGAAIVACNHISLADPPILVHALRRAGRLPRALATAGLFRIPVLGRLLRALGYIPVLRGTATAAAALAPAAAALAAGELVMLYPEGGISHGEQWPGPGKTGAARLALTTGAPVIPVAQWGAQRVLPPGRRTRYLRPLVAVVTRPRVRVLVGEPLHLTGDPDNLEDLRAATAAIMAAITGQLEVLRGPRPDTETPTAARAA